ncbi:V-ATPase V1 sector subunit E [Rhizina undulata]
MAHSLSDEQVTAELRKMVAFIKLEAEEKAREIGIKADEEFAIEKSKLVRQETSQIDSEYDRKFKQAELSQQIARSNITNKTRLRVLSARQSLLEDIFEKARGRLSEVAADGERYTDIVKNLILEGLYALGERSVVVRVREADVELSGKAIEGAKEAYKETMGTEVAITIDDQNYLPSGSHGGVFIVGGNGKITINNTLEERLKILEADSLPVVRASVFGENPNRKFYD